MRYARPIDDPKAPIPRRQHRRVPAPPKPAAPHDPESLPSADWTRRVPVPPLRRQHRLDLTPPRPCTRTYANAHTHSRADDIHTQTTSLHSPHEFTHRRHSPATARQHMLGVTGQSPLQGCPQALAGGYWSKPLATGSRRRARMLCTSHACARAHTHTHTNHSPPLLRARQPKLAVPASEGGPCSH